MTKAPHVRRLLLLAPLAALLPPHAMAADAPPRTVAILSLLGDELTTVIRRVSTGSQLDRNDRQSIPIDDPSFDAAAMDAAERAIVEAVPGAERLRFGIRDKALFAIQDGLLQAGPASDEMRKGLQGLLQKTGATHLLLVTKRRDDFLFKLADGNTTGAGKVSGVGLYIDNQTKLASATTGQHGTGFFVCYAYVKLTLVEAATLRVVATRYGSESIMTTPIGVKDASSAWEALPDKGKVENLKRAIDEAVYATTREIMSAR
ncbi:MAG: hypothetical protein K8R60_14485 [Burkholderiales bacterium]|nr:hypothetical protein [Burkholderiales bacterium]